MFDFKNIPDWWALCPGENCPRVGECLRHRVYYEAPTRFSQWACVLPHVRRDGECWYFQKDEIVRMVRGMKALYAGIRDRRVCADIRKDLMACFGSNGAYYRYHNGERWMNPEMQQMIQAVLKRNGYNGEAQYDEVVFSYDFTVRPEADI